jgi:hypothetical protein
MRKSGAGLTSEEKASKAPDKVGEHKDTKPLLQWEVLW